jgi:hypothetical protein
MGYELHAVIGRADLLADAARAMGEPVLLSQSLALLPMTDELFDTVTDGAATRFLGFWKLPGGFEYTLAQWSFGGPVAYVEAEYVGGAGRQRAAVWEGGVLPEHVLHVGVGESFPSQGSPISQVLRRLGAVRGSYVDEFEAVGLRRHRRTEDWADDTAPECRQRDLGEPER